MSCVVGHRRDLDPSLLWLWCRLAFAALIQTLAWELPYASGAALKKDTPPPKKKTKSVPNSIYMGHQLQVLILKGGFTEKFQFLGLENMIVSFCFSDGPHLLPVNFLEFLL